MLALSTHTHTQVPTWDELEQLWPNLEEGEVSSEPVLLTP
jgi:hypothetical protein